MLLIIIGCGRQTGEHHKNIEPNPVQPPPGAPGEYKISEINKYYVIKNKLVNGPDNINIDINTSRNIPGIELYLDDKFIELKENLKQFEFKIPLTNLSPSRHKIIFKEAQSKKIIAEKQFILTHPFYVFVSSDWDYAECTPEEVKNLEKTLHKDHKELKITHFVGPYIFTDPLRSGEERRNCVNWVNGLKKDYGDEIGLHIHPWCHFVKSAGLNCKSVPNLRASIGQEYYIPDLTGYAVALSAYSYDETLRLLQKANELFVANGLNKPTSFRAGGWTANLDTLRALAESDFKVDASGADWRRLPTDKFLYEWNRLNWSTINDMSQPYYPSKNDILSDKTPQLPILEVPDNGMLVGYNLGFQMINIFKRIWDKNNALLTPKVFSIGYHNTDTIYYKHDLEMILQECDRYLLSKGEGPVVYVTASEIPLGLPLEPRQ